MASRKNPNKHMNKMNPRLVLSQVFMLTFPSRAGLKNELNNTQNFRVKLARQGFIFLATSAYRCCCAVTAVLRRAWSHRSAMLFGKLATVGVP
jgi:hypothetical protein